MNHPYSKDNMLAYSPALQHEPDAANWAFFKSLEHGQLHEFTENITHSRTTQTNKKQPKNIIERLNGIIDTEDPKFDKTKRESYEKMEQSLESICEDVYRKTNSYYECQNSFSESIQHAIVKKREENAPELDDTERPEMINNIAQSSWIFQTLPGTTSVANEESLTALNEKLIQLPALSLWNEPMEITNGGPEFFDKLRAELLTKNCSNTSLQAQQITALFGSAVLSGNQDLILQALETLAIFVSQDVKQADLAFESSKVSLVTYIEQMRTFSEAQPYQHAFLRQNISRSFGIGSLYPTQGLTERNTSITCDGTYLYLAIGVHKRATLFKIGTGQFETTPGKVYLQVPLDREGEITWVFCAGKLYLRRSSDEFGTLQIYDPMTFQKTGTAKLFLADMPQLLEASIEQANRNCPLLVDPQDGSLCIITVQTVKRERQVKDQYQAQFEILEAKKVDDKKKRTMAAENAEEFKKLPNNEQLKRQKERIKKSSKEPPGPPQGENHPQIILQDLSSYSVLAFELHKFDISGNYKGTEQKDQTVSDVVQQKKESELLKDALVSEMYMAFSGLFKVNDCARALQYNKNQIEAAANWLVAEMEQPDTNVQYRRISTTLLQESQQNARQQGDTQDTSVRPGSLLQINCVTGGRWTLNQSKLSYHQTTLSDQSSIHTFSTDPQKKKSSPAAQSLPQILISRDDGSQESRLFSTKNSAIIHQMQMTGTGMAAQYYWDGTQWVIMSHEQFAATIDSCRSAGKEAPEFITEEDLYEAITLSGTHESTLTRQRVLEPNFQTYITYCSADSRFYSLPLGSSQRIVYSADDLSDIKPVKAEKILSTDLTTFIKEVLQFLNTNEKFKWRLPWRWSNWSQIYRNAISQQVLNSSPIPHHHTFMLQNELLQQKLGDTTATKKRLKKLKKRLEQVESLELQKILKDINLQPSISPLPAKPLQKPFSSKQTKPPKSSISQSFSSMPPNQPPSLSNHGFGVDSIGQPVLERDMRDIRALDRDFKDRLFDEVLVKDHPGFGGGGYFKPDPRQRIAQLTVSGAIPQEGPRCQKGHLMKLTSQPIQRQNAGRIGLGISLNCNGPCKQSINLLNGYYHCGNQTCDYDFCKNCGNETISREFREHPGAGPDWAIAKRGRPLNHPDQAEMSRMMESNLRAEFQQAMPGLAQQREQMKQGVLHRKEVLEMFESQQQSRMVQQMQYQQPPESRFGMGGSGQQANQFRQSQFAVHANQTKQQAIVADSFVLPKELICIPLEISKHYAFCQTGSTNSLLTLLALYTHLKDKSVLHALLHWSVNASYLATYESQSAIDKLYQLCIDIISTPSSVESQLTGYAVRILVVGWWLFTTDVQKQLEVLNALLKVNDSHAMQEQTTTVQHLLDPECQRSAVQLLAARFCQQASFYDLEVLNARKVYSTVILVKQSISQSVNALMPKSYPPNVYNGQDVNKGQSSGGLFGSQMDQITEIQLNSIEKPKLEVQEKPFIDLKPRYLLRSTETDFFSQFPKSQISITEVSIDQIQLRRVNTKQKRIHNPHELSYSSSSSPGSSINQAFFAMPVAACLTYDLFDNIEAHDQITLENVLRLYITDLGTINNLSTNQEKFDQLQTVKQKVSTLQQTLIQTFKQKISQIKSSKLATTSVITDNPTISQGCSPSTSLFAYFLGQALDWTDFDSPSQTQLLFDAIDTAVFYPRPCLLHQIQIALGRVIGKACEAIVAHVCLPKLYALISGFIKMPVVIEKEFSEGLDVSSTRVWETAHPYSKQEDRKTHQMKVSGAIGYSVEFDRRCSTESPGDVLTLRTQEYNFQLSDSIGTDFKFERRPHHGQTIILMGEQLSIEFRNQNPRARNARHGGNSRGGHGGRGGAAIASSSQTREEMLKRWGYKLTIRPIFGSSKFGQQNLEQAFTQNSIVQSTNLLALALTEASFITQDEQVGGSGQVSDSSATIKKTLSWHLFKGGLKISELEHPTNSEVIIGQAIANINKISGAYTTAVSDFLKSSTTDLKFSSFLNQAMTLQSPPALTPLAINSFTPQSKVWQHDVKLLIESPNSLKDIIKNIRVQVPYPLPIQQQMMKRSFAQHRDKWDRVEQILVVAMLYHSGSMTDAQKYSEMSKESVSRYSKNSAEMDEATVHLLEEFQLIGRHINIVLNWMLARLQGQSEFQMIIEDTISVAQTLISERLQQKQRDDDTQGRLKQEREQMEMAEKETRIFNAEVDAKLKGDALSAQTKLAQAVSVPLKQVVVTKIKQKTNTKKRTNITRLTDSIAKIPKKKVTAKEESKKQSPVSIPETAKVQEVKVAELPKYCELTQSELADLKAKILTKAHQDFIDNYQIDGDLQKLLNLCMFFDLDLNISDLQQSLKQVFKRVKLRIKPLLDLDSVQDQKVPTQLDLKDLSLGSAAEEVALDVSNRIMLLLEIRPSINYQQEVTRISNNRVGKMQTILEQDEDIQSQLSGHQQSLVSQPDSDADDDLEELLPLMPSRSMSLPSTVSIGIARLGATAQPPAVTRARKQSAEYAVFIDSYRKWRIWSKRNQDEDDDLFNPNCSPLHGVVAFAKMSKIFDPAQLRSLMKDHIYRAAFRLSGLQQQEKLFSLLQEGPFVRFMWGSKSFSLHKSVLNEIETCGETMTRQLNAVSRLIVQQLMSQVVAQLKLIGHKFTFAQSLKQKKTSGKPIEHTISTIQPITIVDQKRLLLTLNDIRIMLSNIYTKEYVLESLRVDKKISSRNNLGVDQIQIFLRAVVSILVKSQATQVGLNVQISQASKLVLDIFIHQSETVKTETQRILLEMLLDTVVTQLQASDSSEKMQLLQLLSEVIRISIRSDNEQSILQPGSVKVSNCVKLLTKFICNSHEVPAVVRQAIRCAKLLLKQLGQSGQSGDLGFCKEVLKALGMKIMSYKPQKINQNNDEQETIQPPAEQQIETKTDSAVTETSKLVEQTPSEYFVYAHLNIPHEEDFTFLVTALFHWELSNPIYSASLHKNVSDIVKQVVPPKPAASITSEPLPPISGPIKNSAQPSIEAVEQMIAQQLLNEMPLEDRKEAEQHEGDKDWQTDSSNSGDEKLDKLEPSDAINQLMRAEEALQKETDAVVASDNSTQRQEDQLAAKMQSLMNKMRIEQEKLIEQPDKNAQAQYEKRHEELEKLLMMEQSLENGDGRVAMKMMAELEAHQILKEQQIAQKRISRPGAPPNKYGGLSTTLKLTYVQLAIEEITKTWKAPLSTDSDEIQERKLKEINFLKQLQLITKEAVEYSNQFFHQRNSLVLSKRPMSLDKCVEFANLLKLAYIGKVEAIPVNPNNGTAENTKKISCVNMTQAELFPLTAKKVQDLGKQDQKQSPVQPVQISVAPKRLIVTIIEKNQAAVLEKEMATKLSEIKTSQKSQRMGPIVHSKSKKQKVGFSISIIIGELILFLRSLSPAILTQIFNACLKSYLSDGCSSSKSSNLLFGILGAFGGWNNQIATGTVVEVNTNEQWCRGTIVESGFGKRQAIVALDDEIFTLQKVAHSQIRVFSGNLTFSPDQKLLSLSVIKAAEGDPFLLSLMLRACSKVEWSLDENDPDYKQFLQTLIKISKSGEHFEEDKSKQEYESALTLTWERLIDINEQKSQLLLTPKDLESSTTQAVQTSQAKPAGIQNNEYSQLQNSYLTGLPEASVQQGKSEANLKLLYYWEKNIIPQILNFCQGTYRPYEFEYYFEQVRYHLRRGDSGSAINDAMTMLEHKVPPGMVIPDENQDWSSKIVEECIVGNWLLAKIKQKNSGSEADNTMSRVFLQKLDSVGVEEILVQIKAVDGRSNAVLAEYVGLDQMQSHYLWIPISNLKSLYSPLPSQSLTPLPQLHIQFKQHLQRISSIYCRETLTNFVEKQHKIPSADLKIEELISWSIWQNFSKDALVGWMKQFSSALPIKDGQMSEIKHTKNIKGISLNKILNKQIDLITSEDNTLLQQTKASDTTGMLSVLQKMVEEPENQKNLIDWCATIWYQMAHSVSQNRCVVDVCSEYEKYSKLNPKNMLIPLHELLPNQGGQSVGTLLMLKKNGVKLAPCSKVQFFSDPEMVNLIHELNAGSQIKKEVPPIVLQYSHIWVYHDPGTNALLSKEQQHIQLGDNVSSSLQTAIISIPKEWQIACWLTETLSTSALNNQVLATDAAIEVFQKLISSLVVFYEDSKAPNMFKSVVLKLLSRLLIKLRHILKRNTTSQSAAAQKSHFEKMFVSKDFVRNLLSELMIQMESEDCLHCAFVQDSIEFLMSFVIPVDNQPLKTHSQMLDGIQVPQWITPILHLSYFLHYFRGEMDHLPEDSLSVNGTENPLESFILIPIKDLPQNYSIQWLLEQIKSLILSHQGRILNLSTDMVVCKDHLVILLDGWSPLKPLEVKEAVDSDIEEEIVEVKLAVVKETKPTVFSCMVCTFENPLAAPACDMCQSPRPPMEVIMEEFRKANAPPELPKPATGSQKPQSSLAQFRIAALVADLKKIISKDQKHKLLHKIADKGGNEKEDSKEEEQEEDHKSDSDDDDGEPQIDLQNLPDNPEQRFIILGIDTSLLETGDQDLITAIEMSQISEIQAKQHLKKEAKAQKLAEKLAEKKLREKEKERQKIQQSGGNIFKLPVYFGNDIFASHQISQVAQDFLLQRLQDSSKDEFQLSQRVKDVIAKIHSNWQLFDDLTLPTDEPLLEDLSLTNEIMSSVDVDTLTEVFLSLALADVRLFYKVMQSQGYDLWMTQASLPSKPTFSQMKLVKNVSLLEKVKRLIEQDICQEQKLVTSLEQSQLRLVYLCGPDFKQSQSLGYFDESQISHLYPELCESVTQAELRYMWAMLKKFNEYYAPVVPYINQSDTKCQTNDASILPMTMAAYMSQTRDLCFKCVKTDLRLLILERTTQPRDQAPKLYFERLKLAEGGVADGQNGDAVENKHQKKDKQSDSLFMFVQAHNQIRQMEISLLRPKKPQGAEPHIAFEIIFKNEHVVGEGGPYRQFFADVSKELQPSRLERGTQQSLLDLLAPCANQRESEKVGKDRFVIQSQSMSQTQLSQYEFLGILMGVCIRTGANLILDLPQFFWKQLVGQKITLDDLYEIEIKLVNNLKQLLDSTEDEFNANEHFWTTTLSDGFVIDLRPQGKTTRVYFSEIKDYVSETIMARLRESQIQYNAIKRGIAKVIPPSLFNIVTAKELEIWVCGRNNVDIDLLRRHTKYQGGSDAYSDEHPVIKNFWLFLASLREDERQKFIKFCWGQERIPANDEAFISQNVRFMIKPAPKQDKKKQTLEQDKLLPKADTCFFNFELPNYTTLDVMRAKILQAITLDCVSMNAEDQQQREQMSGVEQNSRGDSGMGDEDNGEGMFEDEY